MDKGIQKPPHILLTALEWRVFFEMSLSLLAWPVITKNNTNDNKPVLVIPGLSAGDLSTLILRKYLKKQGYAAYGWGLGINKGREEYIKQILQLVSTLHEKHGVKVSIVGWSMGGIFAREVAKNCPDKVHCVITLGTPFTGDPNATRATRLYRIWNEKEPENDLGWQAFSCPPDVPTTSIFSKSDGIVNWQLSINSNSSKTENIRVSSSHLGIGHNPVSMVVVGDRLSQDDLSWKRFKPKGIMRLLSSQFNN